MNGPWEWRPVVRRTDRRLFGRWVALLRRHPGDPTPQVVRRTITRAAAVRAAGRALFEGGPASPEPADPAAGGVDAGGLTGPERDALDTLRRLHVAFAAHIIGRGAHYEGDLGEVGVLVHALEGMVARQVASRFAPQDWRPLGVVSPPTAETRPRDRGVDR